MSGRTQLQAFVEAHGPTIALPRKTLTVAGVSVDGDIAVATFKVVKGEYSGVLCTNYRLFGKPGAEVWSVMGPRGRTIAEFAIHNGQLISIR